MFVPPDFASWTKISNIGIWWPWNSYCMWRKNADHQKVMVWDWLVFTVEMEVRIWWPNLRPKPNERRLQYFSGCSWSWSRTSLVALFFCWVVFNLDHLCHTNYWAVTNEDPWGCSTEENIPLTIFDFIYNPEQKEIKL